MGFRKKHVRSLSDCTEVYDVVFDRQTTVYEFIQDVLKRKEWGRIFFIGTEARMQYDNGKVKSSQHMDEIRDMVIEYGSANGGWGNMDYKLFVKETVKQNAGTYQKAMKKEEEQTMAKLTKKALLEKLAEKNIKAELHVERCEEKAVRNPGAIGICKTKNDNLMVYMVNEKGKLYNTSVHTDRRVANARVLERLMAANA